MGKDKKEKKKHRHRDDGSDDDGGEQRKRHHKKSRRDREDDNDDDGIDDAPRDVPSALAAALTWGLLRFPKLLDELPQMMAALDAGQLVNIAGLSNQPLREYLEHLFALLPACLQHSPGDGWYKVEGVKSVSGWLLHRLLATGAVVQPSALSAAQQLASRAAPVTLLDALGAHPSLAADVPPLLGGVARGGMVVHHSIVP